MYLPHFHVHGISVSCVWMNFSSGVTPCVLYCSVLMSKHSAYIFEINNIQTVTYVYIAYIDIPKAK